MSLTTLIFITAMGLVLIVEGLFPFISPKLWRRWMSRLTEQSDLHLRVMGIISLIIGTIIIMLVHMGIFS